MENILGSKEDGSRGQSHRAWGRVWDPEGRHVQRLGLLHPAHLGHPAICPLLPISDLYLLVASSALCLPPSLFLGGLLEVYTAVNCCSSVSSSILKGRGSTSEATGCPRVRRPLLSNGPGGVTWYTAGKQAWNIPQKWLGQSRCPNASRSLSSWELGFNEKTVNTELQAKWASLVAQMVKDPPAMWKTQVRSQGLEDPLEKGMATFSNMLAWRIPWTEQPGGLQSTGSQRVQHD